MRRKKNITETFFILQLKRNNSALQIQVFTRTKRKHVVSIYNSYQGRCIILEQIPRSNSNKSKYLDNVAVLNTDSVIGKLCGLVWKEIQNKEIHLK